jgi:hypothetical protein
MEITINDSRKIFAIQKEFSDIFPFLKLEFYSKPHQAGGEPFTKLMKHISKTIAECRTMHSAGILTIQPLMTARELEQGFRDIYGLTIQVFYKSGGLWLETTETTEWTLERQNKEAKELNRMEKVM